MTHIITIDTDLLYRLNEAGKDPLKRLSKLQEENGELAEALLENLSEENMLGEAIDVLMMLISIGADYVDPEYFSTYINAESLQGSFEHGTYEFDDQRSSATVHTARMVAYVSYSATLGNLATHVQQVAGVESSAYKGAGDVDVVFGDVLVSIKRIMFLMGLLGYAHRQEDVQVVFDKKMAKWEKVSQ